MERVLDVATKAPHPVVGEQRRGSREQPRQAPPAGQRGTLLPLAMVQRYVGNAAVQRIRWIGAALHLQRCGPIACGCPPHERLAAAVADGALRVSTGNDPSEREAERIADAVMRMPQHAAPALRSVIPLSVAELALSPSYRPVLQRELITEVGAGRPLEEPVRSRAETMTGIPARGVRIHDDPRTRQTVDLLQSAALTVGDDILLGSAAISAPGGRDHVVAHEVAHSLQQHPSNRTRPGSPPTDYVGREAQADQFADAMLRGAAAPFGLTSVEPSLAQRVIWKQIVSLPNDLLLIIDVDDGDFVGGCVRAIVPHAGVKLIQTRPTHTQLFNLHLGFITNAAGEFCMFFYESVTGICEMKCAPSKEEMQRRMDEFLEWIKEMLQKVFTALAIVVLLVIAAILAYLIAQALVAALAALLVFA